MEVTIRAYDPRDAADLADVFFRSVRQVALSDYTAAQVRAWAPEPRTAEWAHREASDGRLVLVAANEDDRPVAYIDLEPNGHIDRLFRAPEATGQGIASRLYDAVEAAAREQGIRSLFTEASELARRLFEHKGFAIVERQDLVIRGVAIHNYRMAKALDLTEPHLPGAPCRAWSWGARRDGNSASMLVVKILLRRRWLDRAVLLAGIGAPGATSRDHHVDMLRTVQGAAIPDQAEGSAAARGSRAGLPGVHQGHPGGAIRRRTEACRIPAEPGRLAQQPAVAEVLARERQETVRGGVRTRPGRCGP